MHLPVQKLKNYLSEIDVPLCEYMLWLTRAVTKADVAYNNLEPFSYF